MNVLILHGIGGHAGIHWQQWLNDQLTQRGHVVVMPELPASDQPDRKTWLEAAQASIAGIDTSELMIIGHSLGATTALDLIEQLGPLKGFVSVAGFAYDYGAELNGYFLAERSIDFDLVNRNLSTAAVLYGDNDPYVTREALKNLADNLSVEPIIVQNGGHLNTDTGYTHFPLLLETINTL